MQTWMEIYLRWLFHQFHVLPLYVWPNDRPAKTVFRKYHKAILHAGRAVSGVAANDLSARNFWCKYRTWTVYLPNESSCDVSDDSVCWSPYRTRDICEPTIWLVRENFFRFFTVNPTLRPGCASLACLSSKLIRSKKSLQTGHGYSPMSSSSTIFAFFLCPLLPSEFNFG